MTRRRHFMRIIYVLVVLGFAFLGDSRQVSAQPTGKVWRIGWLGLDSSMQAGRLVAFESGLRDLGYVDGKNVSIELRWAEGRFDRLPALAAELAAMPVDVIVTASPPGVRAALGATRTIPIVMMAHEPVQMKFIESLARPGGNVTGIAFQDTDLSTKRLELLRQAVADLSRLAILWNSAGTDDKSIHVVEDAAKAMGLQVLSLEVNAPRDFPTALAAAKAWGAQALLEMASPIITKNRQILIELLKKNNLPASCEMRLYVVEGCLMTYSANLDTMFYRQAYYVDRILKGESPAVLAVEQPRDFEFVINLKSAQALGLTVPQLLLFQATEVIR
jgi:putative ABC transport system substrate-binding protein